MIVLKRFFQGFHSVDIVVVCLQIEWKQTGITLLGFPDASIIRICYLRITRIDLRAK